MPKAEPLFRCFTARCDGSACHVRLSGARVPLCIDLHPDPRRADGCAYD